MDKDQTRARLDQLARRHAQLSADLQAVRDELLPEVRKAAGEGIQQVEIVRITGWTREHIRNIVSGKVKK